MNIARIILKVDVLKEWHKEQLKNPISVLLKGKELEKCLFRQDLSMLDLSVKIYLSYWDVLLLKDDIF